MTEGAIGIAPEIHDICASKLVAMREKDFDYVGAAIEARSSASDAAGPAREIDQVPEEVRGRAAAWVAARSASGRRANVRRDPDRSGVSPCAVPR